MGQGESAHYLVRLIPYRNADEQIKGVVVTFVDITSLTDAEEHQKVLIAELNHRVKNMLTVVISIAQQTLKRTSSPEAFNEALLGRLHSMARSYGLLSRENWIDASVEEQIRQELEPFDLARIAIEGPDVRLKPQKSLSLGMALHELATNAAKYGGLSSEAGHLEVKWSISGKNFELEWKESDGPPVDAPETNGFGLTLLRGEIEYRLGGKVHSEFKADGLVAAIEFPLE